ncbi:MAG: WD40 repeat domain-containing protein [Cyanobacteria bacterium P01_G01_bin.54]
MYKRNKKAIANRLTSTLLCLIGVYYSIPSRNVQAMGSSNDHCLQSSENTNLITEHSLGLKISRIPVGISEDTTHPSNYRNIFWSPDGSFFARKLFIRPEQKISIFQILDTERHNIIIQFEIEGRIEEVAWSPDSQYLAFSVSIPDSRETRLQLLDLTTKQNQQVVLEKSIETISPGFGIKWSPDSQHFVVLDEFQYSRRGGNSLQLISLQNSFARGSIIHNDTSVDGTVFTLAWSPDSQNIVVSYAGGRVVITNIARLNMESDVALPVESDADYIYWTQNKTLILVSTTGIIVFDITNNEVTNLPLDLDIEAVLSRDQRYLVVRAYDSSAFAFNRSSATTKIFNLETNELTFETPYGLSLADLPWFRMVWSPDNQYLAINDVDCGLYVYAVATGTLMFHNSFVEPNHSGPSAGFDWSPDGRYLAMSEEDGNFRIIDIAAQREVALIEHGLAAYYVLWSPDGQRILMLDEYGELQMIELEK